MVVAVSLGVYQPRTTNEVIVWSSSLSGASLGLLGVSDGPAVIQPVLPARGSNSEIQERVANTLTTGPNHLFHRAGVQRGA